VCIESDKLCDLDDDCGDATDEAQETCAGFKRDNFESEQESLFQNLPAQHLNWKTGSGESGWKLR
jgi:hypothetical protein